MAFGDAGNALGDDGRDGCDGAMRSNSRMADLQEIQIMEMQIFWYNNLYVEILEYFECPSAIEFGKLYAFAGCICMFAHVQISAESSWAIQAPTWHLQHLPSAKLLQVLNLRLPEPLKQNIIAITVGYTLANSTSINFQLTLHTMEDIEDSADVDLHECASLSPCYATAANCMPTTRCPDMCQQVHWKSAMHRYATIYQWKHDITWPKQTYTLAIIGHLNPSQSEPVARLTSSCHAVEWAHMPPSAYFAGGSFQARSMGFQITILLELATRLKIQYQIVSIISFNMY